jgi:hypothetical protein
MPLDDEPLEESVFNQPVAEAPPAVVEPTSQRPTPSSEAPGYGGTSGADDRNIAQAEEAPPEPPEPLPSFDPKSVEDFEGLLYIGSLAVTFPWVGHKFKIRTLTTGELLEVGMAVKKYDGTVGDHTAYQAAICAACLVTVDGNPLPMPIAKGDSRIEVAFAYVLENWFPSTISKVYDEYYQLEFKVREVIEAMGKVSG